MTCEKTPPYSSTPHRWVIRIQPERKIFLSCKIRKTQPSRVTSHSGNHTHKNLLIKLKRSGCASVTALFRLACFRRGLTAWNLDERLGGPVSCGETDGVFPCRLRIRHGACPCPPAPATPTPLRPTSARSVPARTCLATACACS